MVDIMDPKNTTVTDMITVKVTDMVMVIVMDMDTEFLTITITKNMTDFRMEAKVN